MKLQKIRKCIPNIRRLGPRPFFIEPSLAKQYCLQGKDYTFWGKGVSQGHSDAVRRVPGVKYGIQYTVPIEEAIDKVRSGENPIWQQMRDIDVFVMLY